jgi:hypothetical protein
MAHSHLCLQVAQNGLTIPMLSFLHTRPHVSVQACELHRRRLAQAAQNLQPTHQRHVAQAEVKAAQVLPEAVARHPR